jgi:Fe-Mn family superoxide dismutase
MISLGRRRFLTNSFSFAAISATSGIDWVRSVNAGSVEREEGPFILPPLPYANDALEPVIDAWTVALHHDMHHLAYVDKLNTAAKYAPEIGQSPMADILASLNTVPAPLRQVLRDNMGGHANHSMYWLIMGGDGAEADGHLLDAIRRDFGGIEKMKRLFEIAGEDVFGSGWVFVTVTREGRLAIETRPNQETPLMDGKRVLFGNDVWEHAHYLRYRSGRADYLKAWWDVVNWQVLSQRFAEAKEGRLTI